MLHDKQNLPFWQHDTIKMDQKGGVMVLAKAMVFALKALPVFALSPKKAA